MYNESTPVQRRRRTSRPVLVAAMFAVVSLLAAACSSGGGSSTATTSGGSGSGSPSSSNPIYFGAVLALTGPYAAIEVPNLQGLQAGVALINKNGGLLGRKVVLEYKDDQSDPTKAAAAIQALLSSNKYSYVEPEVIPALQSAMLPYTNQQKIISIEPTLGPGLFDPTKNPYNFTIVPGTYEIKGLLAGVKTLGGSSGAKLAIVNDTVSADVSLADGVASGIGSIGGSVVNRSSADPTATDLSIQVGKAKAAGANVLFVMASSGVCTAGANAVHQLGWTTVKVLVAPSCASTNVMTTVPSDVQARFFAMAQSIYLKTSTPPTAQENAFMTALQATGPLHDLAISTDTNDCVSLAAWAIKHAGSTDTAKMLAALESLHKTPVPDGTLLGIASPRYSSTDHGYDSADVANYYALLNAGTPVDGKYTGEAITLQPSN